MFHGVCSLSGLALVRASAERNGSKILLVQTGAERKPWELPESAAGESANHLLEQTKSDLFPSGGVDLTDCLCKTFATNAGERTFYLTLATDAEINPYLQSRRTLDARWASFEEAFYIARLDLEKVLRWTEHNVARARLRIYRSAA
jgi:hypothetical protein